MSKSLNEIAVANKGIRQGLSDWWDKEVVGGVGNLGIMIRFVNGISAKIAAFFNRF